MVHEPPNFPGWSAVPLREMLNERLPERDGTPIVLVKDADAAALGEYRFGAGREERERGEDIGANPRNLAPGAIMHLVYLTISTGVGGGVIVDGKLLLGSGGLAGELGHITIDLDGPRCFCGNTGCLEAMASGMALAREAAMVLASHRETSMAAAVGGDPEKITAEIVVKAAREGDAAARELMDREGMLIGVGIVNCVHTFNPQLVVLGGGVSNAGELLFRPVRATVEARIMRAFSGTFDIVPAALGGDSGALGAIAAALENVKPEARGL
jgi:glucokinase